MEFPFETTKLDFLLSEKLNVKLKSGTSGVKEFSIGQSNPTYLLDTIQGRRYVLRKKPHGVLLDKAHLINREFKILSALTKTDFPSPKPHFYCTDTDVIGTEFYVMEYCPGRVFDTPQLEGLSPEERNIAFTSMVDTLAKLHSYDHVALGLGDFGKASNFVPRLIHIWEKNYNATPGVPKHPEMAQLIRWLKDNIPSEQGRRYTIVHGDYTLINVALTNQNPPFVSAVFDWELSTIGLPLSDLASFCVTFVDFSEMIPELTEPQSLWNVMGQMEHKLALGTPEERDILRLYCKLSKTEIPSHSEWNYFKVLGIYKVASILQGVYGRSFTGNASSTAAGTFGDVIGPLIKLALKLTGTMGYIQPIVPDFISLSTKGRDMLYRVKTFMNEFVYPNELKIVNEINDPPTRWKPIPTIEKLKLKAKKEGLWNLFLPGISGLTQMEYALIAEETGRFMFSPVIFNCGAPDTGNMETLWLYGTADQKAKWLVPLLSGEMKSAFAMTEPEVASSDATNMQCTILPDGTDYVVNGHKWWISGVGEETLGLYLVFGTSDPEGKLPRHKQHSVIIVPSNSRGIKLIRHMTVFGYDEAPHGHFELEFNHVRVPKENMVLGEGCGFEISQGRLGPGRVHHCMRLIGMAERCLELACKRALDRKVFGKKVAQHGMAQEAIALSRIEIDQARLLVLQTAFYIDRAGPKAVRKEVSMIKVAVPQMACRVIDRCLQIHGGMGVCQDTPIAAYYAGARSLRIADGPDEVHLTRVAQMELMQQAKL